MDERRYHDLPTVPRTNADEMKRPLVMILLCTSLTIGVCTGGLSRLLFLPIISGTGDVALEPGQSPEQSAEVQRRRAIARWATLLKALAVCSLAVSAGSLIYLLN